MRLEDIQRSISQMSDTELVTFIEDMRKKRGKSTATTVNVKDSRAAQKAMAQLTPEEMAELVKALEEDANGK